MALKVLLAGRYDQICLKLFAAADQSPRSKHVADLIQLAPSSDELQNAADWVKTQDLSTDFGRFVDQVVALIEASLGPF